MKQHSTKVFRDIVNALGSFIQSLFIVPNAGNTAAVSAPAGQFPDFLRLIRSLYYALQDCANTFKSLFFFLAIRIPGAVKKKNRF